MEKSKTISIIIKTSIGILFGVFFVILLSQYISIAQLNSKNEKLKKELALTSEQYQTLDNEYQNISSHYEDYVEDYVRDNYDYVYDDEILINK